MSKELKALEDLIKDYLSLCEKLCTNKQEKMLLDSNSPYNVLKTYLEQIENVNSSEALECINYIEKKLGSLRYECERTNNHRCDDSFIQEHIFATIKQSLIKSQEQEKVLNTIKKHFIFKFNEDAETNGNVWGRLVSIQSKEDEGTWDTTATANIVDYKEEFDLLKRYWENE